MDIKIQPGNTVSKIEVPADTASNGVQETADTGTSEPSDPVTAIATDLVEGRIDTVQAVDRLIEQTMSTEMVANAPTALRAEVEQVLRSAIETDTYLVGLTQKLE